MEETIQWPEKRCRTCLKSLKRKLHCIESKTVLIGDQKQVELSEIYSQCTQLSFDSQSDAQWKWVCGTCFEKLVDFYKFRRMCIESYTSFKEISLQVDQQTFEEVNFKLEAVEIPLYLYDNESNFREDDDQQKAYDTSDVKTNEDFKIIESRTVLETNDADELLQAISNSSYSRQEEDDDEDYEDYDEENSISSIEDQSEPVSKTTKSKSNESVHVCDICSKKFFKKHRFDAHKRKHLGLKQWQCEHCDKGFEKYSTLKVHLSVKHYDESEGQPQFICDVDGCGKSYSQKESLRVHIAKIHLGGKPKSFTTKICEQCGKTFKNNASLIKHSYTHTKVTPHKCHICSKMFATNYKLKEHIMRHDGIKNFVCPTCGLRKTTGHELRVHMKYHSNDIQFPCELCSLVFTRQANMKRHMRVVHCGVKAYPCPHCDRSFGKSETLKHHVMTHTGERPNKCEICDKRFIQPIALKTHMKTHNKK